MFVIRRRQIEAFAAGPLGHFEERVVERLKRSHPIRCQALGEGGVHALVAQAVERARDYGIDGETDLGDLVRWMLAISPDFDREVDWVKPILEHPGLSGRAKMQILRERLG